MLVRFVGSVIAVVEGKVLQFEAGAVADLDEALCSALKGLWEAVEPESEPVEEKAYDAPPKDKMVRKAPRKKESGPSAESVSYIEPPSVEVIHKGEDNPRNDAGR